MSYSIQSIETRYAGHLFRSRLEARWAAMFDLLGWGWTYEPFDLKGWVPDFILHPLTEHGNEVLVEVKGPASEWEAAKRKIEGCQPAFEVLLLGARAIYEGANCRCCIGELCEWDCEFDYFDRDEPVEVFCWWCDAPFGTDVHGLFDFTHSMGSYEQRLTGFYPGGSWPGMSEQESRQVQAMWGRAHEITRWNPKQ